MSRPRKDYGCPLRIWRNAAGLYVIMPPRSERAATRWLHVRIPGGLPTWDAVVTDGTPGPLIVEQTDEVPGPHLGQRIAWSELPSHVQEFVRRSVFGEYCPPLTPERLCLNCGALFGDFENASCCNNPR